MSEGRSPDQGAGERPDKPLLTRAEREAMQYFALAQMAQIADVHGALGSGDTSRVERIDRIFVEDRLLVDALSDPAGDCEATFRASKRRLLPALERLRETASQAEQEDGRALLVLSACDRLLAGSNPF